MGGWRHTAIGANTRGTLEQREWGGKSVRLDTSSRYPRGVRTDQEVMRSPAHLASGHSPGC